MATEKITLDIIKNRSTSDYEWLRSGHPLSGYSEVVGPPISSILSSDETGVTIETTTYFEGRLLKTEFRLAKDLQALADIVDNINSPAHSGPHEFVLVSENDTEAGYLNDKVIDGEGTLTTVSSESDGIEQLKIDVRTKYTIEIDDDFLQLVGDENVPGSLHYYGTNVAGDKGWYGFTEIPMPAVTITDQDNSSDYLNEKVSDGEGILKTITETSNGEQTLDFSVRVKRSVDIDLDFLQLENDEDAPGNSKFYGTSLTGVKGWQDVPIKKSLEQDSEQIQFVNDELIPGNSKFYGTSLTGVKGWQDFPIKNSIELNSEQIQFVNDELIPGNSKFYGTDLSGVKGWHSFIDAHMGTASITSLDTTSGYVDDKVIDGDGILKTVVELDSTGELGLDLSVKTKNSVVIDSDELQFVNDELIPGNSKFYGTDLSGVKGWHSFIDAHQNTVSITVGDAGSDYLDDKVVGGNGILTNVLTDGVGDQTLDFSVQTQKSVEILADGVQLLNDAILPGNGCYYGTDEEGAKGFHSLPVPGLGGTLYPRDSIAVVSSDPDSVGIVDHTVFLVNDENVPEVVNFYGTCDLGIKGWHSFLDVSKQSISISETDVGSGYLIDKLLDGDGILKTVVELDSTGELGLDLSVGTKNSVVIDSNKLQLFNDELIPGNSKFYGTSTIGIKGWQDFPIKNSIELNSEQLQLVNDQLTPGVQKYYGTDVGGNKGFFSLTGGAISITDDVPGYLEDKIEGHQTVSITKEVDSAFDEVLEIRLASDEINPGNQKYYGTDEFGIKGWHDREFFPNTLGLGGFPDIESIGNDFPILRRCSIDSSTGIITNIGTSGDDIVLSGNGTSADQQIIASKIWNAVWNDMADFQDLSGELVYGKCYYDTMDGAKICTKRCQSSVIGIASNTFGYALGVAGGKVPIAISGWVLAHVDKEYEMGIPLTNDEYGDLTEMTLKEKQNYPERIVAIYKKKELTKYWGPNDEIIVDDRHWVKIK